MPAGSRHVGRYRLRAEIGRGGMGAVFVADYAGSAGFRKRVAVKMLRADRARAPMAESLRREAKTAVRLEHPHIAQIYDLSEAGDDPYVVMEYVHGESLASLADAVGALPYPLVAWIGAAIAEALSYAHDDGHGGARAVVHRDLSPQNILVSYEGVPKLVDFGIAVDHGGARSEPDPVRGRLAYMAPEQRRGEAVDGRADLYALGVVLYQLAAGAHPWQVAGEEVERPPHPGALRSGFPDPLWRAIHGATEPARDARVATARELLALLRQCAGDIAGHDMRDDLARLMGATFEERRREKEAILARDLSLHAETEALESAAPAAQRAASAAGESRSARRGSTRPWRWIVAAALVAASLALLAHAWRGGVATAPLRPQAFATAGAWSEQRPCVLVDPRASAGQRDATWAAARIVGIMLERAGRATVHGYRAQDARGWSPQGLAEAREACAAADTSVLVYVRGSPDGAVSVRVGDGDGGAVRGADAGLVVSAREALERAGVTDIPAGALGDLSPQLDNRATILSLVAREDLLLEHRTDEGRDATAALAREYPALEGGAIARWILLWWAGELDAGTAPPAQSGLGERARALREAIVALATRDPGRATEAIAPLLEDRRHRDDPLVLYLAGEAYVHQGRPAEGVAYLDRALDADPQLSPAIYHVFERRLAEGDRDAVVALADLWQRIDPAGVHGAEFRAHAALGAGEYEEAVTGFRELLHRDRSLARENGAHSGLVHALILAGRDAEAVDYATQVRPALTGPPPMSWVMIEPILYALGVDRGDEALTATWEHAVRSRLAGGDEGANHWLLRYTMALIDTLAGRDGARERWLPHPPPPGIARSYRFASHRRLLAVLEGREPGDGDVAEVDPGARRLAEALARERAGELAAAAEGLRAALASSRGGEFDCIAAAALARVERAMGDTAGAREACERVLHPCVPRAYCLVLRPVCAMSSAP